MRDAVTSYELSCALPSPVQFSDHVLVLGRQRSSGLLGVHAGLAEAGADGLDMDSVGRGDLLLGRTVAVGDDDLRLREEPLCVGGICRLFRTRGRGEPLGSPWRRRLRDWWRRMQWLACSARPGPLACPFKCLHESERSRCLGRVWTVHSGSIYAEPLVSYAITYPVLDVPPRGQGGRLMSGLSRMSLVVSGVRFTAESPKRNRHAWDTRTAGDERRTGK